MKSWFSGLSLLAALWAGTLTAEFGPAFQTALYAADASPCAQHAVEIQALAVDSVVSVTRFQLQKIDPAVLNTLLGKMKPAGADAGNAGNAALDAVAALLQTIQTKLTEAGITDFYRLQFENGTRLTVFPASNLQDAQKQTLSSMAAGESADSVLVERFGFLILSTSAEVSEQIKTVYAAPNSTPRPSLTAGLNATEGGFCSVVWIKPDSIFDIPNVGKISPLAKEQADKMSFATLTISMVDSPKAVILLQAADADAMADIADSIKQQIELFKTDQSMLENMMDPKTAAVLIPVITLISNSIQTQVEHNQMIMTLDLGAFAQDFISGNSVTK